MHIKVTLSKKRKTNNIIHRPIDNAGDYVKRKHRLAVDREKVLKRTVKNIALVRDITV